MHCRCILVDREELKRKQKLTFVIPNAQYYALHFSKPTQHEAGFLQSFALFDLRLLLLTIKLDLKRKSFQSTNKSSIERVSLDELPMKGYACFYLLVSPNVFVVSNFPSQYSLVQQCSVLLFLPSLSSRLLSVAERAPCPRLSRNREAPQF